MNKLLLTAMKSANQIMQAQAVNTNNLANASTDGFRAELAFVSSGASGQGVYSQPDLSSGTVRTTGRSLDVSVHGDGWIAIDGADGSEAYSKRGDLQVDAFGQLTDGTGNPIIGNNGPIALPPFSNVEIAGDGTISIQPLGQTPNTMAVVDRIKLVSVSVQDMFRGEDGLLRLQPGKTASEDASVRVTSGSIEAVTLMRCLKW